MSCISLISPLGATHPSGHLGAAAAHLSHGLDNTAFRTHIAVENLTNSQVVASTPGGTPYQRRVPTFRQKQCPQTGVWTLQSSGMSHDQSPFKEVYNPHHPAAHPETGLVLYPNIERQLEIIDFQEASVDQSALTQAVTLLTTMQHKAIDLMVQK